jgi:hexosaminidase
MIRLFKRVLHAAFLGMLALQADAQLTLVPRPVELKETGAGQLFTLTADMPVVMASEKLLPSAEFMSQYVKQYYGVSLKLSKKPVKVAGVLLKLDPAVGGEGAYTLDVSASGIVVSGADETGVFYGVQSLLQLLPVKAGGSLVVPGVQVKDAPRFGYRGVMLDVGRHFFSVDFIKKFIDYIAVHKINTLHWHLTEDQGWRIEIKKHPQLTAKGAYRNGTIIGHHPGSGNTNQVYGGFYTQQEVKDIVAYAAKRYITVVPEIEMPGHASAAIAAYPNLSCYPGKPTDLGRHPSDKSKAQPAKYVQETWGVHNDVFCAGNDSVYQLLQDVIDEVVPLFPSKLFHIGGDECPKAHWKTCPRCQARMKEHNLKDEHELQSYFIQRMEKYINSKGKILIGWDEILEGGLAPNAWVMSWRGEAGGIEAAKQRHDVIMTPTTYVYFDYYQGKAKHEPLAIGGYLPLSKVYSYNPIPSVLTAEEAKHIKGIQANVWTEYVATPEKAEYMLMPRLAAAAEVAWSPQEGKSWDDFTRRMEGMYGRYALMGINYAKSAYDVRQTIVIESVANRATVSFQTDAWQPDIRYTLDGSTPTATSLKYTKPFDVRKSVVVKAAVFQNGQMKGVVTEQKVMLDE